MLAYHFFAIFVKKTLPWKPSICDVVHSDVQVRMRDLKTRQNFMQEKVEKLDQINRPASRTNCPRTIITPINDIINILMKLVHFLKILKKLFLKRTGKLQT